MEFLDGAPLAAFRAAAQPGISARSSRIRNIQIARTSLPYRRQYGYFGTIVFGDIKGVLVRDDGEITVSGFERLTDMKE